MNFYFKTSIDLGDIPAKEFLEAEAARKSSSTSYGKNQRSSMVSNRSLNYHIDIMGVVDDLKEEYKAYKYHMLCRNCNHFSNDLLLRLFAGR